MENKANYTLTGLFVFVFITGIIWFGLWLSVGLDNKVYKPYLVYMEESVSGLSKEAPVKFNGVTVGLVRHIALNKQDPQQVMLLLDIEAGTPITISTRAQLRSQGITGLSFIGLSAKSSHSPPLTAINGNKYPIIKTKPSLLFQLDAALDDATKELKTITQSIEKVLSKENVANFSNLVAYLTNFSKMLSDEKDTFAKGIEDAKIFLDNAKNASKSFPEMMEKINSGLQAFTSASNSTDEFMNTGEASLDTFNRTILPTTLDLITELESLSSNLNGLTKELKRNPSMLLRGKSKPKLGPGEK